MVSRSGEDALNRLRKGKFGTDATPGFPLKLLSWNIERGLRLPAVTAILARERPQICLLQEVDWRARRTGRRDVAALLAERLHFHYVFAPEFEELGQGSPGDPAYHGQATLAALPVVHSQLLRFACQSRFWLPRWYLPNHPKLQRRLGGRMALVTEFRAGERRLVTYNVHLESRGPENLRLSQLEEILADVHRYPALTPVVIAGDFNTRMAPSPLTDRLETEGFGNAIGQAPAGTNRAGRTVDWIFVRGLRVVSGWVLADGNASDHHPLEVLLDLAGARL